MTDAARERVLAAVLDGVVDDDLERARLAADIAVPDDPAWAGALLAFTLFFQRRYADAAGAADAALAAAGPGDPLGLGLARAARGLATAGVDSAGWASEEDPLNAATAALAELGTGELAEFARYLTAEAALACGRLDLAAEIVELSGPPALTHPYRTIAGIMRVRVLVFRGRIAEASAMLAELPRDVPVAMRLLIEATETLVRGNAAARSEVRALADRIEALHPDPRDYLSSGRYLLVAFGLVAVGDVGRAARLALDAGRDADLSGYVVVDRGLTFELLVAAAAIDGDLDAAESWAERSTALLHSPIAGSTIERITSRIELMRGNAAGAVEWADRAVASARAEGRIVEAAEGEVVASRARIAASQTGEAGIRLEAMVGEADDLGFAAVRRSAARELRAVGRRLRPPPGSEWDGLSPRERDVALMLAEDLTNAQIASALHLSEHTVRGHVSRVLAAFGAASRSRVAGRIAGLLPPVTAPAESLTPRQRSVAALIAHGAGNAEIAGELGVSVKTVEQHVGEILRRWDMRSRVAVARAARSFAE